MSRILTTSALIVTVAGLGLLNAYLLRTPVEIGALSPAGIGGGESSPAVPPAKAQFRLDATTPLNFPETGLRPLFWASRRPEAAKPDVAAPVQPVQPAAQPAADAATNEFRLAGIMQDERIGRRALIVWPELPEGRWLAEGAQFAGWRLAGIGQHAVRIEAGTRSRELKLP